MSKRVATFDVLMTMDADNESVERLTLNYPVCDAVDPYKFVQKLKKLQSFEIHQGMKLQKLFDALILINSLTCLKVRSEPNHTDALQ